MFSPSQIKFDAFEKYILETYATNWKKNGGFIVKPPSSLKLLPTKTENRLPTNGRSNHLKQKMTPLQQVYTPPVTQLRRKVGVLFYAVFDR